MTVYLDWAATALHDESLMEESLRRALSYPANPSAGHRAGTAAREKLEEDRQRCAHILGCSPDQLYFTSGGTESNNAVLLSRLQDRKPGRLIISALEHPSLSGPAEVLKKAGWELKILKPDESGVIGPERLRRHLTRETRLVSPMAVHNETGVIQNLGALVETVRDFEKKERTKPILFHSDMVQAAGKIPLNLKRIGLDSASFSSHKLGGPKGVGLLYLKKPLLPLYRGGGQERGVRSGTESLFNSHAMALSLERGQPPDEEREAFYRSFLEGLARIEGLVFNPPARLTEPEGFVPQIISFALPPLPGEVLQRVLDERGFQISTGSACSSHKKSHTGTLLAMGISERIAHCSVRVSLGPGTTREERDAFLKALGEIRKEYVP